MSIIFRPVQLTSVDDMLFVRRLRGITVDDSNLLLAHISRQQAIHTNFEAIGEFDGERAAYATIGVSDAKAEYGRRWLICVEPKFKYLDITPNENFMEWAMQSLRRVEIVIRGKDWIKAACFATQSKSQTKLSSAKEFTL